MTPEGGYTRQFSRLICDALRDPATADKNALLTAANAVLDTFKADDDDRAPFVRTLAYRAMDWVVFEYPEYHEELKLAVKAFNLACDVIRIADKIGN